MNIYQNLNLKTVNMKTIQKNISKNLIKKAIRNAKKDILQFKKDNPNVEINSFYELHDYFDANDYVKLLVDEKGEFMLNEANSVLKELDNFIKELNK